MHYRIALVGAILSLWVFSFLCHLILLSCTTSFTHSFVNKYFFSTAFSQIKLRAWIYAMQSSILAHGIPLLQQLSYWSWAVVVFPLQTWYAEYISKRKCNSQLSWNFRLLWREEGTLFVSAMSRWELWMWRTEIRLDLLVNCWTK